MRKLATLFLLLLSSHVSASEMGTVSFYGDSFVYRSAWQCNGLGLTPQQCEELKADSSFATHVPYPYDYIAIPAFDLVTVDGRGGSTCLPRTSDAGLISRLYDSGEQRIAVLIGINDMNLANRSVAETVNCIKSVWSVIADQFDAYPVAITYPPIDATTTVWSSAGGVSGQVAAQNRIALNNAIVVAANDFNAARLPGQKLVHVASFSNAYSPEPMYGSTTDGVHPTPTGALTLARYFYWAFH